MTNFDEKDFEIKKPVYQCRFCQREHDSKFQWAHHELRHTGWKYYKCVKCGWESKWCGWFTQHVQGKIETDCTGIQGMTKAEIKEFYNRSRKNWELEHTRILGNVTNFDEKDFEPPKVPKPDNKCRFCSLILCNRSRWAMHELRHTGWNSFKCMKCGKKCPSRESFDKHIKGLSQTDCTGVQGMTKKEKEKFWKMCKKDWKLDHPRILGNLTSFNESDFKTPKPINKCRFCGTVFKCRTHYALHELRHIGWNHYKCIKCGKECANAASFGHHVHKDQYSKCPGGAGLSKDELKLYYKKSARDWKKAHENILGPKTAAELEKMTGTSGFKRILSVQIGKRKVKAKIPKITMETGRNPLTPKPKKIDCGKPLPAIKDCRVVLTRMNLVQ